MEGAWGEAKEDGVQEFPFQCPFLGCGYDYAGQADALDAHWLRVHPNTQIPIQWDYPASVRVCRVCHSFFQKSHQCGRRARNQRRRCGSQLDPDVVQQHQQGIIDTQDFQQNLDTWEVFDSIDLMEFFQVPTQTTESVPLSFQLCRKSPI